MRSYAAEKLPSASKILPGDTTVLAHLSCSQVTALPNSEGPLVSLSALSGMGVRKRTEISSKSSTMSVAVSAPETLRTVHMRLLR